MSVPEPTEEATLAPVLVTGANGFVGAAICRAALAAGHREVLALVRPGSDLARVPPGARIVIGHFTDGAGMRALLEATRPAIIIHAAAVVPMGRADLAKSLAINVEGTATLLAEAHRAGVDRWVQISSMSAHPANKSVYGATKCAADQRVRQGPVPWTIIRPSLVYGPGEGSVFHKMLGLIRRLPIVPLVGGGREPMRPVHVDDLAAGVIRAAGTPLAVGREYCLGGPEDWCVHDMVLAICQKLGRRPLLLPVPLPLCRLIAAAGEVALARPPLTLDNLEGISRAQPVDIASAVRDLGWQPRAFSLDGLT